MIRKFALTLAAAGALVPPLAMPASANMGIQGAPGGAPFRVTCDGGYVSGFEGRSGAFIDHVRVICSSWDAGARAFRHRGPLPIQLGTSQGGGRSSVRCPAGWAMAQISFQNTWRGSQGLTGDVPKQEGFVHHIHFLCARATSTEVVWRTFGPASEVVPPPPPWPAEGKLLNTTHTSGCPAFQFVTGLEGRAGTHIDAIGLICEPVPGIPAGAPVASTPAPQPQPAQQQAAGPAQCKSGFVWRVAGPNDFVCVTPDSRARAAQENKTAAGAFQPGTDAACRSGFVKRAAFAGDVVCVPPDIEQLVKWENSVGHTRVAGSPQPAATTFRPMGKRKTQPDAAAAPAAGPATGAGTAAGTSPQSVPSSSAPAARGEGFTGLWLTTDQRGATFELTLIQNGREVMGSYVTRNGDRGEIEGRVGANVMQFNWSQASGFKGRGQFNLSPDGNSFVGIYRADPDPRIKDASLLQGTWNATRK